MNTKTTLILTPDTRAVAQRKVGEVWSAMRTIHDGLKDGETLDAEFATTVLKVSEFYLADLGKALGIETEGAREREQRDTLLREANARVHELETQLGNAQGPDVTQAVLKNMADQLNGWWDLEGFGHISDIAFGQYVCKVNFSCNLFGTFPLIDSPTPISDKEREVLWHASLRERGFVLTEEGREVCILDCDASRKTLIELIQRRLPSAKPWKIENTYKSQHGEFVLRGVEVNIHKIADILTLPVPPKKER